MTNPYKILGVSPEASDEEIKLAYRELVHKYHPDKYVGTDLSDMATEKMKEINAAYEEILQMRKQRTSHTGSDANSKEGSYGYRNESQSSSGAATFSRIRMHINSGELDDAEVLLRGISDDKHGAEWHFLFGCVMLRRGYIVDAQNHLDTACRIDPYNSEYRTVRDRLKAQTAAGASGYRTDHAPGSGCACSLCDICTTIACIDCCCDCFCHT
jgi:hypothetical protein